MPTLFLGNADTEAMVASPQTLDAQYRQFSTSASRRHLWMMEPGDAIVLPCAGTAEHLRYIEALCGFEQGTFRTFYTQGRSDAPHTISRDGLSDLALLDRLKCLHLADDAWRLEPYIADQVAFEFARLIKVPVRFGSYGTPGPESADLFNDKRVFRGIASGLGVPTAPGRTCSSPAHMALALNELMPLTGSCIVKLDRHSGAQGNVLVTRNAVQNAPGTHKVHHVSSEQDYKKIAGTVCLELSRGQTPFFVVESYFHTAHSVGIHYLLSADEVILNGIADIRLSPAYAGMVWPTSLPHGIVHQLLAVGYTLARGIAKLGHRGPLSVDAIICPGDRIMVSEVNARHGGFTAAKAVIDKLLPGDRKVARIAALRTDLTSALDFRSLVTVLEREALGFNRDDRKGIVVTVEDLQYTGRVEILTVAESVNELEHFEERFIRCVCRPLSREARQ